MFRRTALFAVLLLAVGSIPAEAHPASSASGFQYPESVWWDGDTGTFFVSNFGGQTLDPGSREPDGYLSRLSGEGRVTSSKWVTGLRSPKGIRRVGDALYVADVGQVVVIDVAAAAIRSTIDLDPIGARFPNDVAVDGGTGDVFVSDMLRNAIYRLPGGEGPPEVWLESPDLESPNGLLVDGATLLVASYGRDLDPATFAAGTPGRVLTVDLATKAIAPLGGMGPTGQLDGIEKLGDGYVVTDNPGGRVLSVTAAGAVTEVASDVPGAADLGLRPGDRIAAVPQLSESVVRFIAVP